jgi:UDP-N-acetyl-D-glucosamine/UDP-N-acetyl-D-galactosamine dehydrogenase
LQVKKSNTKNLLTVVGLGYVGLPLAVEFSKKIRTAGFDISKNKIKELQRGNITSDNLNKNNKKYLKNIQFTSQPQILKKSKYIIICVPTPINQNMNPDLKPLIKACQLISKNLTKDTYLIFESTVYPGMTEEICIPILEKFSKLKWKVDFNIGYSPERISPGQNSKSVIDIKKIISGDNEQSLKIIKKLYLKILKKGVYEAKSIKVAEAAKILENTQRDVNIALINEISIIFNKLEINTKDVVDAAGSKWNFMKFYPGLVGGHCISVDPYYLRYRSLAEGYSPELISLARRINNYVPFRLANEVKKFLKNKKNSSILILGVAFKENCQDVRNSKVVDLINDLKSSNFKILVNDPLPNKKDVFNNYKIKIIDWEKIQNKFDVAILSTPHDYYKLLGIKEIAKKIKKNGLFIDIKNIYNEKEVKKLDLNYLTL